MPAVRGTGRGPRSLALVAGSPTIDPCGRRGCLPRPLAMREEMQRKAPKTSAAVPAHIEFADYRIADPEEFNRNMLRVIEAGSTVLTGLLERSEAKAPFSTADMLEAGRLFSEVAQFWIGNPAAMAQTNATLLSEL